MKPCVKCGGTNFRTVYERQRHKDGVSFPLGDEWACKEFSHKGERWTVTLCRCQSCSSLRNHIETRKQ